MSMNKNYRRGSLVWPILLIGLGVVFLLNNLGVVSWSVWSVLIRMWPVVLVAVGLDLMFGRRSGIGAAIAAFLIIALFAGVFWTLNVTGDVWNGDAITESIQYESGGADTAVVRIDQNVGELLVGSLDEDAGLFVKGEVTLGEDERLQKSFDVAEGSIDFSLSSDGQPYYPGWLFVDGNDSNKTWRFDFATDIMLDLEVNNGVGRTALDLTDLSLSSLDVNGGVGEVVVHLPRSGSYTVYVDAGVGLIEVRIPENVAAEIHIDSGLGDVSVLGDYDRRGDVYSSSNFEDADDTATIYLDGGVGSIKVIEVKK